MPNQKSGELARCRRAARFTPLGLAGVFVDDPVEDRVGGPAPDVGTEVSSTTAPRAAYHLRATQTAQDRS